MGVNGEEALQLHSVYEKPHFFRKSCKNPYQYTTSHTRIRIRVTVEFISVAVSAFIYTSNASTTKDKACMGTCW